MLILFFLVVIPTSGQEIFSVDIDSENIDDLRVLSRLFQLHYKGEVAPKDIATIEVLYKEHGVSFLKGTLSQELPEVIEKSFIVIALGKKAIILGLAYSEILEKRSSSSFLVGGIHSYRGIGYYHVYFVSEMGSKKVFKSDIPIYNVSHSCESYESGQLSLQYEDINLDGYKDLCFEGIKNWYCEGLESDRTSDVVVKKEKVVYRYLFDSSKSTYIRKDP